MNSSSPTLSQLQSLLRTFTASSSHFKIIHSLPLPLANQIPTSGISTLLILDASFNPPTKAHAYLVHQALKRLHASVHTHSSAPSPTSQGKPIQSKARVLLLLSTKNADKPSSPAAVEHRLAMMISFARDIWSGISHSASHVLDSTASSPAAPAAAPGDAQESDLISGIDVAVTTEPLFLEKSLFLGTPGRDNPYLASDTRSSESASQWHLLGFDTVIRLLNGKYYPPEGSLEVLKPLFQGVGNRVLVVRRDEDRDGEDGEQDAYVKSLSVARQDGGFDAKGWNADWGSKFELVDAFDGVKDGNGKILSVSSTAVRKAVDDNDVELVKLMCGKEIGQYIIQEKLYT